MQEIVFKCRIKRLIRDHWCPQTPVSMYVISQRHDNCNSLWISENRPVDHIGVLLTPIMDFAMATDVITHFTLADPGDTAREHLLRS